MIRLDLTLPSPEENLALDEALLLAAEAGEHGEVLRFWESPSPFVVLGVGNRVATNVNQDACARRGIPVLRRCTGGGTVLQGPGCLNYSLVLRHHGHPQLASIHRANHFVMERNAATLERLLGTSVEVAGHTDLTVAGKKVSGNAQRRMRDHLLFHGTLLINLDISLVAELLAMPSLHPPYRQERPHSEFLTHLRLSRTELKEALTDAWDARGIMPAIPMDRMHDLVRERYSKRSWNFRT